MRDHLLGYAASAAHSAQHDEEFESCGETFDSYHVNSFPLGVPTRYRAERAAHHVAWLNSPERQRERDYVLFEKKLYLNPDGTATSAKADEAQARHAQAYNDACRALAEQMADAIYKTNALLRKLQENGPEVMRLRGISVKPPPGGVITVAGLHAAAQGYPHSGYDLLNVPTGALIGGAVLGFPQCISGD